MVSPLVPFKQLTPSFEDVLDWNVRSRGSGTAFRACAPFPSSFIGTHRCFPSQDLPCRLIPSAGTRSVVAGANVDWEDIASTLA